MYIVHIKITLHIQVLVYCKKCSYPLDYVPPFPPPPVPVPKNCNCYGVYKFQSNFGGTYFLVMNTRFLEKKLGHNYKIVRIKKYGNVCIKSDILTG